MSSKTLMASSVTKVKSRNLKFSFFHKFSKYGDVSNFNFNTRKQHSTINMQLRCITGIENNISQMVKIEENENLHPRKKMTSSLKMAAFLENFFTRNNLYKSQLGTQNFRFIAAVVKKLLQFESSRGPPPGIGLNL